MRVFYERMLEKTLVKQHKIAREATVGIWNWGKQQQLQALTHKLHDDRVPVRR
jgi:hypothetical protein